MRKYIALLLIFCLLPFALGTYLYKTFRYVKTGSHETALFEKIGYPILAVVCIVFAVWRKLG